MEDFYSDNWKKCQKTRLGKAYLSNVFQSCRMILLPGEQVVKTGFQITSSHEEGEGGAIMSLHFQNWALYILNHHKKLKSLTYSRIL